MNEQPQTNVSQAIRKKYIYMPPLEQIEACHLYNAKEGNKKPLATRYNLETVADYVVMEYIRNKYLEIPFDHPRNIRRTKNKLNKWLYNIRPV